MYKTNTYISHHTTTTTTTTNDHNDNNDSNDNDDDDNDIVIYCFWDWEISLAGVSVRLSRLPRLVGAAVNKTNTPHLFIHRQNKSFDAFRAKAGRD